MIRSPVSSMSMRPPGCLIHWHLHALAARAMSRPRDRCFLLGPNTHGAARATGGGRDIFAKKKPGCPSGQARAAVGKGGMTKALPIHDAVPDLLDALRARGRA